LIIIPPFNRFTSFQEPYTVLY